MKKHKTIKVPLLIDSEWVNDTLYEKDPQYGFEDSAYAHGGKRWAATTLYKAAEEQGCKQFALDLKQFDLSWMRYPSPMRVSDFAFHLRRALLTDLTIPVLLGPMGGVMDGAHRIAMAVALGITQLPCLRLRWLPPPDEEGIKEEDDT